MLKGCDWHSLYEQAGCSYARSCNSIEFNDRSVGIVATVHYIVDVHNSGMSVLIIYNHSLCVMKIPIVGDVSSVFVFSFDGVG